MIDVIDYGGGNVGSVARCLARLGAGFRFASSGGDLASTRNPVLLPGVGSFGGVMEGLARRGLDSAVKDAIESGRPFLGICVGLQALFEESEETQGVRGLGIFKGKVVRFGKGKVPQVGWNLLEPARRDGWPAGHAYFVNSYFAVPEEEGLVLYRSDYHGKFCAAVACGSVTAFQFHPERSGPFGHMLMRRWVDAVQADNPLP